MPDCKTILIVTDAWKPQINGVVRTLLKTVETLEAFGHRVHCLTPESYRTVPCPLYPEIRLAFGKFGSVSKIVEALKPDHIHIATEGPLGFRMRILCRRRKLNFSTAFHTMFPEYVERLAHIPQSITWPYFRWFHAGSKSVMVPTHSIDEKLARRGIKNTRRWSRGIDLTQFYPRERKLPENHRPIAMYIGRISKEKNVEAFFRTSFPGTRYLVGDGPQREELEKRYPDAVFVGYKTGEELAQFYAEADVFVFPSLTDTFGNVILEALASGVPVAAFPAPGPRDTLTERRYGCCDEDLSKAIAYALEHGIPDDCVAYARTFTWERATQQFLDNLVPI